MGILFYTAIDNKWKKRIEPLRSLARPWDNSKPAIGKILHSLCTRIGVQKRQQSDSKRVTSATQMNENCSMPSMVTVDKKREHDGSHWQGMHGSGVWCHPKWPAWYDTIKWVWQVQHCPMRNKFNSFVNEGFTLDEGDIGVVFLSSYRMASCHMARGIDALRRAQNWLAAARSEQFASNQMRRRWGLRNIIATDGSTRAPATSDDGSSL